MPEYIKKKTGIDSFIGYSKKLDIVKTRLIFVAWRLYIYFQEKAKYQEI